MKFSPTQLYHVYNRGINKTKIFYSDRNYLFFLDKLRKHVKKKSDIIAYCLMPNHLHLLLSPLEDVVGYELNKEIGIALSSYTHAINKQEQRTGSLFQQKTKAKLLNGVNANYAETCFHYIHFNPVNGKLVTDPADWLYSSYLTYAGLTENTIINKELAYMLFDIPENGNHFIKYSASMPLDINSSFL